MREVNKALLKLSKRAEKYSTNQLVESFVDVGPLFTLLSNNDNQVIYGRRGTGKTHVLSYLDSHLVKQRLTSINIDMRTIGSTGGIYSDNNISLAERATRLLSDTLGAIHHSILEIIVEDNRDLYDLSLLSNNLDSLAEQITNVVIDGDVEQQSSINAVNKSSKSNSAGFKASEKGVSASLSSNDNNEYACSQGTRKIARGFEKLRIHFGSVFQEINSLVSNLPNSELWILIDEWSEIPFELQPFLADLLRRTLFPVTGLTVKIAAIEQRCHFRHYFADESGYVGIEIGADVSASLNLDEFMVFDNDENRAKEFFGNMLFKHVSSLDEDNYADKLPTLEKFINDVFTQLGSFDEFVRASEGVPRDAINIIGLAAQKALDKQISIPIIRESARNWYHRSKYKAVSSRGKALNLLDWIVNEVIGQRQARGFLLSTNINDELIEFLFDSRVIHLLKTGVSAQYIPGQRFNVYSLDYGCYVDLLTTKNAPKGLLKEDSDEDLSFVDVPKTDFRSIRNSILKLVEFYSGADMPEQQSFF